MFKNVKEKVIVFIKENELILLVSSFFIGWKFFLISVFFDKNDFSKSEEALTYIGHIDSINQCSYLVFCKDFLLSLETYYGFALLSYRLIFGFIGQLLNMNSQDVFRLGFYIGTLILVPSLIVFLKNIETDKKIIAFLLFFLALYNGGGSHGFWWVVPDFFAILLIFVIYAILLGDYNHWKIILFILIPIGFYFHTIFVYLIMTTAIFYIFYFFFTKKNHPEIAKKIIFSILVLAVFYIPTSWHLKGVPYGPEFFIRKSNMVESVVNSFSRFFQISSSLTNHDDYNGMQGYESDKKLFPGFNKIKERYFDYIFAEYNAAFIILFLYMIFILSYYKKHKLLSLYFTALIFTLMSSINKHADRALPFVWPITFIVYASGICLSFKFIDEHLKRRAYLITAKIFLYSGIIVFIAINAIYSYGVNVSIYYNPQTFLDNYVRHYR